jgi:hypothetical protein
MKASNRQIQPTSAASMPMSREQRQELLRTHVTPFGLVGVLALALIWVFRANPEVWVISLLGILAVLSIKAGLHPIAAIRDLLDGKVYVQTATLTAKDIAMPLETRRALGDEELPISGYYGIFEGIGKLRIGYTAFAESTIGAAYCVAFSRASRRAWSVEPAEKRPD